ncbi:uncharacterized protein BDV17DRAFT_292703 [Aspergillus undulatus]|uniref:uncharacterized protein n=1 Tax=Aspergillus undulatus TaxID=1810928 RepID=UPI003CCC95A3
MSSNTLESLVKPGYKERLVLEIDRRDPDLMTVVMVSKKTIAHSIDVVDVEPADGQAQPSQQQKQQQHGAPAAASTGLTTQVDENKTKANANANSKNTSGHENKQLTKTYSPARTHPAKPDVILDTNLGTTTITTTTSHNARPLTPAVSHRYDFARIYGHDYGHNNVNRNSEADGVSSGISGPGLGPGARHLQATLRSTGSSMGTGTRADTGSLSTSVCAAVSAPATTSTLADAAGDRNPTPKKKKATIKRSRKTHGYLDYPEDYDSSTDTETDPPSSETQPRPVKWRRWV